MANYQNEIDIYYAVGNANTMREENEIAIITKIRNQAGQKLISTSTKFIDTETNLQIFIFFKKRYLAFFIQKCSNLDIFLLMV